MSCRAGLNNDMPGKSRQYPLKVSENVSLHVMFVGLPVRHVLVLHVREFLDDDDLSSGRSDLRLVQRGHEDLEGITGDVIRVPGTPVITVNAAERLRRNSRN